MRRFAVLLAATFVLVLGMVAVRPSPDIQAQDGTPAAGHPLIGAWVGDTDADSPDNPPSLFIFHVDGTYLQADPGGTTGVGAWEATGPSSAMLTAVFQDLDETGAYVGSATLRASIEVDGDALTAEYTVEFVGPDGMSAGQEGPGRATAERIAVEAMGTPAGSPESAPAGTPAG